jgi:transcriptional regulator with XRE-family HTH domain
MSSLKKIREKHGLSVRAFASRIGMEFGYVSKVENWKTKISEKSLKKIALEFKEPLDLLLIAHGYLPTYSRSACQADALTMNKAIKKATKKITEQV